MMCYARDDRTGFRYLLGDLLGHLFMLFLEHEEKSDTMVVKDIKFEVLGLWCRQISVSFFNIEIELFFSISNVLILLQEKLAHQSA